MRLQPTNINAALELLEQHELVGAKIVVNPQRYKDIQSWNSYDERLKADIKEYMSGYLRQDIK